MGTKCVFLDRDNTIIEDPGYLTDPAAVKLLPGVDLALKSLAQAGFKLVMVTNQSAIARGLLTEEGLERVHDEMTRQLADRGTGLDAIYYCPYHPEGTVEEYARESQDRKPQPGMLLRAASELDIDLTASWMVGDTPRDVEAGHRAGCRTIRLRIRGANGHEGAEADEDVQADSTVRNLVDAARVILRNVGEGAAQAAGESVAAPTRAGGDPPPVVPPVEQMSEKQVLREILRHLRSMDRTGERTEFSPSRLLGAVFQILAMLALVWGIFYIPDAGATQHAYTAWHVAMVTAGVFQVAALTFFLLSRER